MSQVFLAQRFRRSGGSMFRFAFVSCALLNLLATISQASSGQGLSDALAVSLAQQATTALKGGASVTDVSLTANVISILGTDYETGTGTFRAKGVSESRVDLNL